MRAKVTVAVLILLLIGEGAAVGAADDRARAGPSGSTVSSTTSSRYHCTGSHEHDVGHDRAPHVAVSVHDIYQRNSSNHSRRVRRVRWRRCADWPSTTTPAAEPAIDSDLFPTWLDLDGDGCDAREDTLIAESLVKATVAGGCHVVAGDWRSIYDNLEVTDPSKLDVDHMVPLAEAWRSGAYRWDAPRRAAYANDMSYADHLIAVTAASNRSKSDSTPDQWRPPDQASWCRYAKAWVEVKRHWALTVTTTERDSLGQMLDTCPGVTG